MTAKKRIAFLCHPYHRGGVTRWMADAAIAACSDHEVYFVTVKPSVTFYSGRGRETLLQLIANGDKINKIYEEVGREFEFGTPEYRAYIYSRLMLRVPPGTPVILADDHAVWNGAAYYHSHYPLVGVLHADEEYYYKIAADHRHDVDLFACVSERVRNTALKRLPGIDAVFVPVIPCGINLPAPHFNSRATAEIKLVYVGRISDYQKRTGDLVKICARLSEQGVKYHLNIIGDGEEPRVALERKVREQGLEANISFLGWLSQQQVASQLAGSDILLLTSDFEGMPIAMMEGLAMGCGFVGTRVSGVEDIEHHQYAAGCLGIYDVGEIDAAVQRIKNVAAIPKEQRMVAARKLAETEFTMQVCLARYYKAVERAPAKALEKIRTKKIPLADELKSRAMAAARALKMKFAG